MHRGQGERPGLELNVCLRRGVRATAGSRCPGLNVRYLLKNNVSPDLCNEDGLTALHQVLRRLDPSAEQLGLEITAEINRPTLSSGAAALLGYEGLNLFQVKKGLRLQMAVFILRSSDLPDVTGVNVS
ncbi:hypothetical protein JZ751_021205 [Albula glossodonta]|uniref:Uncharacterized protein n=1 Tax=Albula glossodonta TaxID=121402 RepID=A0A8T2NK80_9TELE|nr:hypothetical protein JZ751_021205 [Albula glossodonta]